jgi:hypothetical protein
MPRMLWLQLAHLVGLRAAGSYVGRKVGFLKGLHVVDRMVLKASSDQVIRLKRIYNFRCSMLILHHLLHVLFTLHDVFMRFPELTY